MVQQALRGDDLSVMECWPRIWLLGLSVQALYVQLLHEQDTGPTMSQALSTTQLVQQHYITLHYDFQNLYDLPSYQRQQGRRFQEGGGKPSEDLVPVCQPRA